MPLRENPLGRMDGGTSGAIPCPRGVVRDWATGLARELARGCLMGVTGGKKGVDGRCWTIVLDGAAALFGAAFSAAAHDPLLREGEETTLGAFPTMVLVGVRITDGPGAEDAVLLILDERDLRVVRVVP